MSEAAASLETLQGRAEAHATGELARQLDYILASAITAVNWVPEAPPTSAGCGTLATTSSAPAARRHPHHAALAPDGLPRSFAA